ncbi:MAG: hypothetical protein WD005_03595 [Haliea sp.]
MMTSSRNLAYSIFTQLELDTLRAFYDGVPARQLRRTHCDPWPLVAKHRNLAPELYEAVKHALEKESQTSTTRQINFGPLQVGRLLGGVPIREWDYSKRDPDLVKLENRLRHIIANSPSTTEPPTPEYSPSWLHPEPEEPE